MKRHRPLASWRLYVVVVLAGCSGQGPFNHAAPAEDVEFAKSYLALFAGRGRSRPSRWGWIRRDQGCANPPADHGDGGASSHPVNRTRCSSPARGRPRRRRYDVLSQFSPYPDRWVMADVIVISAQSRRGDQRGATAPVEGAPRAAQPVHVRGKGPAHALALVAALLVFAFVCGRSSRCCARRPRDELGMGDLRAARSGAPCFTFNWTTGAFNVVAARPSVARVSVQQTVTVRAADHL